MHPQTKIKLCKKCKGSGQIEKPPEHINDETYSLITCPTCEGSGRLEITITKIIKPFKPKNNDHKR